MSEKKIPNPFNIQFFPYFLNIIFMFSLLFIIALSEDFNFTATNNGEIEISAFPNHIYQSSVKIPASAKVGTKQLSITSIGEKAFMETNIAEISLPNTITTIKDYAFYKCFLLAKIDLKKTKINSIGKYAFSECISLTNIKFPITLTFIDDFAFSTCDKITNVNLTKTSITKLGDSAFGVCNTLGVVDAPNTLEIIGNDCFSGTMLYYFNFPKSLKEIGCGAFLGTKLVTVDISDTLVTVLHQNTFQSCNEMAYFVLPPSLRKIEDYCFFKCQIIQTVDLSYTCVSYLGNYCFASCDMLSKLEIPMKLEFIGDHCFEGTRFKRFIMPESIIYAGKYIFQSNKEIEMASFKLCNLSYIPEGTFANCFKLSVVEWPLQAFNIEAKALYNTAIQNVELPTYLNNIGDYAFSGCQSLTYIDLSFFDHFFNGSHIFFNCTNLKDVMLPTNYNISIPPYFLSRTAVSEFNITMNILKIGKGCFANCSELRTCSLLNSTISILDDDVFDGTNMSLVILPASVHTIGINSLGDNSIDTVVYMGKFVPNTGYETRIGRVLVPYEYQMDYFCGTRVTRMGYKDLVVVYDQNINFVSLFCLFAFFAAVLYVVYKYPQYTRYTKRIVSLDELRLLD